MNQCSHCEEEFETKTESLPGNHHCLVLDDMELNGRVAKATTSPYETKVRREAARRLGSRGKIRRMRDRRDVSGLPDLEAQKRRYQDYLYKGDEFVLPNSNVAKEFVVNVRRDMPVFKATDMPSHGKYLAMKYARELERSTLEAVNVQMDKALNVVRERAEKQLGRKLTKTNSERAYIRAMKVFVSDKVMKSAENWKAELKAAIPKAAPGTVWRVLVAKEFQAKDSATRAARTMLGNVYNSYMAWLLVKGGGKTFRWVNPLDEDTSEVCRKIAERTSSGVSLSELKEVVKQETNPRWYRSESPFLPHPNCRSAVVLCESLKY